MTAFKPIHIPAIRTKGTPIPTPTPRPTLTASVLELVFEVDARAVFELFWVGVLEDVIVVTLAVKGLDDVRTVDVLELDELDELDELAVSLVMLK